MKRGFGWRLMGRLSPSDRTRAEVLFEVFEGPIVRVGNIVVRGAERTSESVVRDLVALRRGEIYRPSLARTTQERLAELGVFTGVTVGPEEPETVRSRPVVEAVARFGPVP